MGDGEHSSLTAAGLLLVVAVSPVSGQTASPPYRPEIPRGLDLHLPAPDGNPLTPEKVALGRALFLDPILSRDGSLSCAGCHDPGRAFTDGRPVSVGVFGRRGNRNVPTLVNRAYGESHFWDGRAVTLEEQVLLPIRDPKELDLTPEEAVVRLASSVDYVERFEAAFGGEPSVARLAGALASYVRTILAGDSRVDRFLGGDREALTGLEQEGLRLFRARARCATCHAGPSFTDERFHNTGIAWRDGELLDPGRYEVTRDEDDRGAFKTPTLREIDRTAPYMHDGSLATLEEVIEFYARGGNQNPHLDHQIRPLEFAAHEKEALLAFLEALTGTVREGGSPDSPVLSRPGRRR